MSFIIINIVGLVKMSLLSCFVFINIVGLSCIFYFPFFPMLPSGGFDNRLSFSNIDFSEISVIYR